MGIRQFKKIRISYSRSVENISDKHWDWSSTSSQHRLER